MATLPLSKKDLKDALGAQSKDLSDQFDLKLDKRLAAQTKVIDQKLGKLATKDQLAAQTKELKAYSDKKTEELARMVTGAIDDQTDHLERHFEETFVSYAQFSRLRDDVDKNKLELRKRR